jgi:hypothetical protein
VGIALAVGDEGNLVAARAPTGVDVDPPVVGQPLVQRTVGADQVDFRISVLGEGEGDLPAVRPEAGGDVEPLAGGVERLPAVIDLLAVDVGIARQVGGVDLLLAER